MGQPIQSILIAGGGIAGWFAAASFTKLLPGVQVSVIEPPGAPPNPLDLYAGTRPDLGPLHERLGFDERVLLTRCGGVFRLGQRLDGWAADRSACLHCYGHYGARLGNAAFHQEWLRADRAGEAAPFAQHSTAVALAEADRFVFPTDDPRSPLSTYDYALALDPLLYRDLLRETAIAAGAATIEGEIAGVECVAGDRIGAIRLADRRSLTADLYVDCTGSAARLIEALDGGDRREDWSRWLPCDRIVAGSGPAKSPLPVADCATATTAGWLLTAPLRNRTTHAHVYASEFAGDGNAQRMLRIATGVEAQGAPIPLRQGRRKRSFIGNCVALGDAAIELEPLGAPGLHLLGNAIEKLLWFLPDTDFDPIELAEYDRKIAADAVFVRDFVILHYALSQRPEPFWRAVAAVEPPPMLAHLLAIFRERGKIPGRDGETLELDDWLAVLFAHGVMPERIDPFVDSVAPAQFRAMSAALRARIAEAVAAAPPHRAFLDAYLAGRIG